MVKNLLEKENGGCTNLDVFGRMAAPLAMVMRRNKLLIFLKVLVYNIMYGWWNLWEDWGSLFIL